MSFVTRISLTALNRDVPFSVLFFPSHALLKQTLTPDGELASFSLVFGSGIVSAMISSGLVTPFDGRLQFVKRHSLNNHFR
jgi:hypothetical protein